MRDHLKISGDYVEKIYLFALKSPNENGLVAKNSLDKEIRLAQDQLKVKEEVAVNTMRKKRGAVSCAPAIAYCPMPIAC